ncbi:hypothetical protein G3M53_07560 [Streptomyces sp. SID7982]|nr:hypothetical protein [Streptomyces sp. SID7982]
MRTNPYATFSLPEIVAALNDGVAMAVGETPLTIAEARFTWPMAGTLLRLADPEATAAGIGQYDVLRARIEIGYEIPEVPDDGRRWTRDQVSEAVNWAVDQGANAVRGSCADDLDNLLVNAVMSLLDDPHAEFEDVAVENYGEEPETVSRWARDAAA